MISRRAFIGRLLAAGAAAPIALSLDFLPTVATERVIAARDKQGRAFTLVLAAESIRAGDIVAGHRYRCYRARRTDEHIIGIAHESIDRGAYGLVQVSGVALIRVV